MLFRSRPDAGRTGCQTRAEGHSNTRRCGRATARAAHKAVGRQSNECSHLTDCQDRWMQEHQQLQKATARRRLDADGSGLVTSSLPHLPLALAVRGVSRMRHTYRSRCVCVCGADTQLAAQQRMHVRAPERYASIPSMQERFSNNKARTPEREGRRGAQVVFDEGRGGCDGQHHPRSCQRWHTTISGVPKGQRAKMPKRRV